MRDYRLNSLFGATAPIAQNPPVLGPNGQKSEQANAGWTFLTGDKLRHRECGATVPFDNGIKESLDRSVGRSHRRHACQSIQSPERLAWFAQVKRLHFSTGNDGPACGAQRDADSLTDTAAASGDYRGSHVVCHKMAFIGSFTIIPSVCSSPSNEFDADDDFGVQLSTFQKQKIFASSWE